MMARVYFQLAGRNSVVFDFICWFFGFFASINWSDRHQSRVHPSLFFQLIFNIIISKKKREKLKHPVAWFPFWTAVQLNGHWPKRKKKDRIPNRIPNEPRAAIEKRSLFSISLSLPRVSIHLAYWAEQRDCAVSSLRSMVGLFALNIRIAPTKNGIIIFYSVWPRWVSRPDSRKSTAKELKRRHPQCGWKRPRANRSSEISKEKNGYNC